MEQLQLEGGQIDFDSQNNLALTTRGALLEHQETNRNSDYKESQIELVRAKNSRNDLSS